MKDRLDVQRAKASKLTGQTTGKRSNLGAEMSANSKAGPRVQQSPPTAKRVVSPQGYAKGGKVHADAAQDRALIRKMIRQEDKAEMSKGGKVPPHKQNRGMTAPLSNKMRRQGL